MRNLCGMAIVIPCGVGVLGAACGGGGGPDISGIYQTTRHEEAPGCTTFAPVADPTHFRLAKEDFGSISYYGVGYCDSPDPTSCADGGFFGGLFLSRSDGWYTEAYVSSGGTTSCSLSYSYVAATYVDGTADRLRVERRLYTDEIEGLTGEDCDPDAAQDRQDDLPCETQEVLEGTRVGDAGPSAP